MSGESIAAIILAGASFVTSLGAILAQRRSGRSQEKRDQLEEKKGEIDIRRNEVLLLRDEVTRLQSRVQNLEEGYDREQRHNSLLLEYVAKLRSLMIAAGMTVPEMPVLE